MSNYLPFGFTYPEGFAYSDSNPDPGIESIKHRISFLNACHDHAYTPDGEPMPGHIFAAAMDLLQKESDKSVGDFWELAEENFSMEEIGEIALALFPRVKDALPYLDFPNAIALFDCRFISTKEWEHVRRYSIGGSEVGTILGVSHFQSPRSLYYEKKLPNLSDHDAGTQQIFDYGHCVEDYTIGYVADLLGAVRYPESRMFAHKEYPFITCNPDGILAFPDGRYALFEAKTAIRWKLDDWKDGIPDYYVPQPRQYLEVLNDDRFSGGYIGCCFGALPCDMKIHDYVRDKAAGMVQIRKVVEYWNRYIVPGVVPDFCDDSELNLKAAYLYTHASATGGITELDPSFEPDFELYFQLQTKRKEINKQLLEAEKAENELMSQIRPNMEEGLTICRKQGDVTYKIKVSESKRDSVSELDIPEAVRNWLRTCAAAVKEHGIAFNAPKVSMAIKAPPKKTKVRL